MEPDPKLLSLLEKVNNPIELFKIHISVKGVFGFTEDWKLTDETNPGIFSNIVRYQGQDLFGKIKARELTEREKFEEYQKNSKKNKKDTKSPEEEEQMKKALVLEDEEEQKKQQYLSTLQEQDKLFFISEDKFKTISIQYEETQTIEIQNVRQLEEEILERRNYIYFIRQPAVTEEELVKLKKGKTKNLNNAELTQIIFKGIFDLSDLLEPGCINGSTKIKEFGWKINLFLEILFYIKKYQQQNYWLQYFLNVKFSITLLAINQVLILYWLYDSLMYLLYITYFSIVFYFSLI